MWPGEEARIVYELVLLNGVSTHILKLYGARASGGRLTICNWAGMLSLGFLFLSLLIFSSLPRY